MAGTKKVYSYKKEHQLERLLEIVQNNRIEEVLENDEPDESLLYHFSPLRENLINWYPFKEDGNALELGADCGAITEALSKRVKSVVAVENCEQKARILETRFHAYPHINVITAASEEIELNERFDYVIIHEAFICDNPQKLLENAIEKLKPEGILLLAVNNRLGLKYFSGAAETDTGRYFEGIRGYSGSDRVASYCRSELCRLLEKTGCENYRFYYPYPDHRFPTEIFTDESIYEMGYGKFYFNVENNRFHFFDEPTVNKVLREERLAANFANSFLVEISRNEKISPNIQYVKMNSDRKKEFRILTVIEEENNEKFVTKKAAVPEANGHIRCVYENDQRALLGKIETLKGRYYSGTLDKIKYPFLEQKTLDDRFGKLVKEGNVQEAISLVKHIFEIAYPETEYSAEYCTEQFKRVFGPKISREKRLCVPHANIDLIFDNLFEANGRITAIDCEWIFDFLVPLNFIKWRTTNELFVHYVYLNTLISKEKFDEALGISRDEGALYKEWAIFFVHEYVKGNQIERYVHPMIGNPLEKQLRDYRKTTHICSKLYVDYGDGFSEENSYQNETLLKNGEFSVIYEIPNAEQVKRLRWDPVDDQCVRIRNLEITGNPKKIYEEILAEEDGSLFMATSNPKVYLGYPAGCAKVINICGHLEFLTDLEKNTYLKKIWEIHHKNRKILEVLEKFYRTKPFRAIRKLYRMIKNKG